MKINLTDIKLKLLASKVTLVALAISLIAVTVVIKKGVSVKGDTRSSRKVVVYDDKRKFLLDSASIDTTEVLSQNNIVVYPEDIVTTELILDPVTDGGAGEKIVIKRAPLYHIDVDNSLKDLRTWSTNVAEIIKKSAILLGPSDQVAPDQRAEITNGETIVITRVKEADVDVVVGIPFETINRGDTSIPFGQKKIVQQGVNGSLKKTYRVTYNNGIEVSRRLKSTVTTLTKSDTIIASGVIIGKSNYGVRETYSGLTTSFYKKGYQGKFLLVTNLSNGKQVRVKIVDYGPINGPILDLGEDAFLQIGGSTSHGHIDSVSVQLVD